MVPRLGVRSLKQERPHLVQPKLGKLTQGSIFCCAVASGYPGSRVYGLTITARCDVAQDKYPVLNYLPVVELKDWLRVDGLEILKETETREQNGRLTGALKQANVSPSIRTSISLEEIARVHFPQDVGPKVKRRSSKIFTELVAEVNEFNRILVEENGELQMKWFLNHRSSSVSDLIRRLVKHDILGFYFFENIFEDEKL